MSNSLSKKTSLSRSALQDFLSVRQCDLSHSVLCDFFFDFGKYLHDDPGKGYAPGTIREILRTLRKYVRSAISEGLVPNIDAIPAAIERLDREVWPQAKPDAKRAAALSQPALQVRQSVSAILRFIDSWATRQTMGPAQSSDRSARAQALENRCAAIYLFCVTTCGLEVRDALAIKRDWPGPDLPDSVYVERLGCRLPLSPTAKRLVELYNRGAECSEHLFFTLDNKKYGSNLDNSVRLIQGHIVRFMSRMRLPLFRRQSVFADWLNYAIECGLPAAQAEHLWLAHLGDSPASGAALAASDMLDAAEGALDEAWYLLSLVPMSMRRDRMAKMFVNSGILGEEGSAKMRIYMPEEKFRDKERGEYAVFSRYIFFRGTPVQAEFANCFSPYAYVLRDRAKMKFAQIRESELRDLQVMLRDFPDAVQLVDGQKWLRDHNAQIVKGCKAIIRSGSLAGKEATVVNIKGKTTSSPTYIIEYIEGAVKFQTNLEGIQLDLVPQ